MKGKEEGEGQEEQSFKFKFKFNFAMSEWAVVVLREHCSQLQQVWFSKKLIQLVGRRKD